MNESSIEYKDFIVYVTYKPHLKHSYISINSLGDVMVKTPFQSQKYILELLKNKEQWIEKHKQKMQKRKSLHVNLRKEVLIFGKYHSIKHPLVCSLQQNIQKLPQECCEEKVLSLYNDFYKVLAQEYITQRIKYFAQLMQLEYKMIKFRKMKSRWGSCTSQAVLTFNTELMKVDKQLIDYVIVHELAHLVHMNHSQAFHTLVELYLSDAKYLKKELANIKLF